MVTVVPILEPEGLQMSLWIDTDLVARVLLADGWHVVSSDSFDLDAYEFAWEGRTLMGGGTIDGVSSTGATWFETDAEGVHTRFCCPITSVLGISKKSTILTKAL